MEEQIDPCEWPVWAQAAFLDGDFFETAIGKVAELEATIKDLLEQLHLEAGDIE